MPENLDSATGFDDSQFHGQDIVAQKVQEFEFLGGPDSPRRRTSIAEAGFSLRQASVGTAALGNAWAGFGVSAAIGEVMTAGCLLSVIILSSASAWFDH